MNELSIVIMMALAAILWATVTYSVGFKAGRREGYRQGRNVTRQQVWSE